MEDFDSTSDSSSELSSLPASPPTPLGFYPTPEPSQDLSDISLLSNGSKDEAEENSRPRKRRRVIEPKPRITQYLDIQNPQQTQLEDQKIQLDILLKVLRKRRKIVVVAGAGISVSAGIPDFRSSTGLFKTLRNDYKLKASGKQLFDASVYKDETSTSSFHDMVRSLSNLAENAQPTAFHHLLARLAKEGRLMRLYTQNVDGIDTSLPPLATEVPLQPRGPWPRTVQLHGGLNTMVCQKCSHTSKFEPALFEGPYPPLCEECTRVDALRTGVAGKRSHGVGKLRPRIVLYNEYNPDEEAIGSVVTSDLRTRPDAIIVVGTTLKIPGVKRIVKEMCGAVRSRRDGVAIWINHDSAPSGREFDGCWDLIVKGDCDEVARQAALPRWDDSDPNDFKECTESDVERAKSRGSVKIIIKNSLKKLNDDRPGVMTPSPSSRSSSPGRQVVIVKKPAGSVRSKSQKNSGKRTNPASKGPSIKDALKKTSKGSKPAVQSNQTKSKTTNNTQKITTAFRVTKPTKSVTENSKVISVMVPTSQHMHPLQTQVHSNGPLTPPPLFPNLVEFNRDHKATPPEEGYLPPATRWNEGPIIFPTTRVPPDIESILN
ncbi:MAG: hypothetical protein M1834_008176 [Cirrosporium novae-zelandiae]|nr:MAG: hypothetical protein M1834_008176 [Cirrosporium novae-zelandiae]